MLGLLLGGLGGMPVAAPAAGEEPVPVTVMSRNLYLGADVGEALERLPDMPAAAQFMWDQVHATDFPGRAPALAAAAARERPEVIALQEATTWRCSAGLTGGTEVVYDFTRDFLAATRAAGVPYVLAEAGGRQALNPGYSIGPIPGFTTVRDPATFRPLFGSDTADCGFEIADALIVRADLADAVRAVGTTEYGDRYAVVPLLFEIDRGFAWADVEIDGALIRFAATHLESMWTPGSTVVGAAQARQLVADLQPTALPLVVIGDLNADPRDPRPSGAPNPGGQPDATTACAPQAERPDAGDARAECNAYWAMVQSGYTDAGPDPQDPANYTWGASALLAGPDLERLDPALALGNRYGFTDRLDYAFVRNGVEVVEARVFGDVWPAAEDVWECDAPAQVANTEAASAALAAAGDGAAVTGRGVCLPTDHAGLLVRLEVTPPTADVAAAAAATAPADHVPPIAPRTLGYLVVAFLLLNVVGAIVAVVWLVAAALRRRRRAAAG